MPDLMPQPKPKRKKLTHVEQQTTRASLRVVNWIIQGSLWVVCAALIVFLIVIAAGVRIQSW